MMSDLARVGPSEVRTGGLLEVDCLLVLVLGAHCLLLHWLIVVSRYRSVEAGHWSVVVGHWSPVVGCWSLEREMLAGTVQPPVCE